MLRQAKKLHLPEKYKVYVELCEKECCEKANYALAQKKELEKRNSGILQIKVEFSDETQTNSNLI